MTRLQTTHACMETKAAPPILGCIFSTLQISMPTGWLALLGLQVKSLQLSWHLTGRPWSVNPGPLVAVVLQRCTALVLSWLDWSRLSIYLSVCLSMGLSICLSIYLSIDASVHILLSFYLSVCLFVYCQSWID